MENDEKKVTDQLAEGAQNALEKVTETVQDVSEKVAEEVEDKAEQVKEAVKDKINERKEPSPSQGALNAKKPPLHEKSSKMTWLLIGGLFVVVVGLAIWYYIANGYQEKSTEAVKVNDKSYTVSDVNFYGGILGMGMTQDPLFTLKGRQLLAQTNILPDRPEATLRDLLLDEVYKLLKEETYLSAGVAKDNFTPKENVDEVLKQFIDQYSNMATQMQESLEQVVQDSFGKGMTVANLKERIRTFLINRYYQQHLVEDKTYTDKEIQAKYEANKDDIDQVKFRRFSVSAADMKEPAKEEPTTNPTETQKELTEEEKKAKAEKDEKEEKDALAKAKKLAEEVLSKVQGKSEEDFKKTAEEYLPQTQKDHFVATKDPTLMDGVPKAYMSPDLAEWLYSPDRKAGDVKLFDTGSSYIVAMFMERYQPTEKPYNSRHILIQTHQNEPEKAPGADEKKEGEEAKKTPEERDKEAKAKAEKILAEYEAGDKTEESFAKLANEYSEDPGNLQAQNGGEYLNITKGQFLEEYEDYCLDPARKPGDVAIVKTKVGYHLIYFKGFGEEIWKMKAKNYLKTEYTESLQKEIESSMKVEVKDGISKALPLASPAELAELSKASASASKSLAEEMGATGSSAAEGAATEPGKTPETQAPKESVTETTKEAAEESTTEAAKEGQTEETSK